MVTAVTVTIKKNNGTRSDAGPNQILTNYTLFLLCDYCLTVQKPFVRLRCSTPSARC